MTTATMSPTAARKQAASEVRMRRQGNGWIVSTWDSRVQCWREGHEMQYRAALAAAKTAREERVSRMLGEQD